MAKKSKEVVTVEKLQERILNYRLRIPDRGVRLDYTLNLDRYILAINGECDCSYRWVETHKTESFIQLMCRCSEGYIVNKLARPNVFQLEESIKQTIETVKEYWQEDNLELFADDWELFESTVDDLDCDTEEEFIESVYDNLDLYLSISKSEAYADDLIKVVTDYPYWVSEAVRLFCKYIVPELRKEEK